MMKYWVKIYSRSEEALSLINDNKLDAFSLAMRDLGNIVLHTTVKYPYYY